MRVLALDTATEACSVALLHDGRVSGLFEEVGRGHAERILSMVDAVLGEAGISVPSLDGIAASVGPGSFTGVRICVSVAQGLAYGANIPVVAVTTLEALALQATARGATQVLACLDARMGEVYWSCFRGMTACSSPSVGPAASVRLPFAGSVQGIGRGFAAYPELATLPGLELATGAAQALPDARDMVGLGAQKLLAGEGIDAAELLPRYLRDKVAFTEAERASRKSPQQA